MAEPASWVADPSTHRPAASTFICHAQSSDNVLFVQTLEQASHGGELAAAVEAGLVAHADVTELGAVLTGAADGRRSTEDITLFDSTQLAIQDLAIAKAAYAKFVELNLHTIDL